MLTDSETIQDPICPRCQTVFKSRKGKVYCSRKCSSHAARLPQNSKDSPSKARKNAEFFDTAKRLSERLYSLPPSERLGFMQGLIEDARGGNTQLREILSNRKLMRPNPITERWMFHRQTWAYLTIAQAANNYCLRFWRTGVANVVYNRVPEPETGIL
jgi:uncharacterized C2H2 Zn-finger protein